MSERRNRLTRRTFLKGAGVAAGTALLGASATGGAAAETGGFDTTFANVRVREARKAWARGFRGRPDRTIGLTDSGVDARHPDLGPWNGVSIEATDDGYELTQVALGDTITTGQTLSKSGVIEPGVTGAASSVSLLFTTSDGEDLLSATATWDQGQSLNDLDFRLRNRETGEVVASAAAFQGPESIRASVEPNTDYALELYTFASGPTTYEITGQTMVAGLSISEFSGSPLDTVDAEVTADTPKCLGWFGPEEQPLDSDGHGTHVSSIMAGSGRASEIDDDSVQTDEPNAVLLAGDFLSYEVEAEAGTGVFGSAYGAAIGLAIEGPDGRQLDRSTFQEGDNTPHDDRTVFGTNAVVEAPTVHESGTATYTVYVRPMSGEAAASARVTRVSVGAFEDPQSTPGDRVEGDGVALHSGVAPNAGIVGFEGLSGAAAFVGDNSARLVSDFGLRSVNMSWGTVGGAPTGIAGGVADATVADVKNITEGGALVVAAAGNSNTPANSSSPALADEAISVVATGPLDGIVDYSSGGLVAVDEDDQSVYGKPDVTAPGGGTTDLVNAAKRGDPSRAESEQTIRDYVEKAGTSMASPYVNGVAGLVAEAMEFDAGGNVRREHGAPEAVTLPDPAHTTPEDVMRLKSVVLSTATETALTAAVHHKAHAPTYDHGGRDPYEGYGRVNPDAAVDAVSREILDGTDLAATETASARVTGSVGLDVPEDSRAVAGFVQVPKGTLEVSVESLGLSGADEGLAKGSPHVDLFVYDPAAATDGGEPVTVASAQGLQGSASLTVGSAEATTYVVVAKLVNVPGVVTGYDVRTDLDLGVSVTAAELPEFSVEGTRSDDASAFTGGGTDQIDVTVDGLDAGVDKVTVYDVIPESWAVVGGDVEVVGSNDGRVEAPDGTTLVKLGEVSNIVNREAFGPAEFRYFVEAPEATGQYTFGPARAALLTGDAARYSNEVATFGGTDDNLVVGADQNDPGSSVSTGDGTTSGTTGGSTTDGSTTGGDGSVVDTVTDGL